MRIKRLGDVEPAPSPYTPQERERLLNFADGAEMVAMSVRARRGPEDRRFTVWHLRALSRVAAAVADELEEGGR